MAWSSSMNGVNEVIVVIKREGQVEKGGIGTNYPSSPPHSHYNHNKTKWISWKKQHGGFVKINFDGSKTLNGATGGFLIRDWKGGFLHAATFPLGDASFLVAEATTIRNGIRTAVQAGFTNIQIECDNKILIQAVQGQIYRPWEIQMLVQDINTFFNQCNTVIINHIFREGNRAADWLAKYGLSSLSSIVWLLVPPRDLVSILLEDNLGRTLERRAA